MSLKDEIPEVLDPLPADVAPEVRVAGDVAAEAAAVAHPRHSVVKQGVCSPSAAPPPQ